MASVGISAALPDPAWAVEQSADGLVWVEISPVLGKGPLPDGIVEELETLGIVEFGDGGLTTDPDPFTGSVRIVVGEAVW